MAQVKNAPQEGVGVRLGKTQLKVLRYWVENMDTSQKIRLFNSDGSWNMPLPKSYGYQSRIVNSLKNKGLIGTVKLASSYTISGKPRFAWYVLLFDKAIEIAKRYGNDDQ